MQNNYFTSELEKLVVKPSTDIPLIDTSLSFKKYPRLPIRVLEMLWKCELFISNFEELLMNKTFLKKK